MTETNRLHISFNIPFITVIVQHLICDIFLYGVKKQKWNVPKTKFNLHHSAILYVCNISRSQMFTMRILSVRTLRPEIQMASVQVTNKEWREPPYSLSLQA